MQVSFLTGEDFHGMIGEIRKADMDYLFSDMWKYVKDALIGAGELRAITVFICLLLFLICLISDIKVYDRIFLCVLILYMYFVFVTTVLIRLPFDGDHANLTPFWSYKKALMEGKSFFQAEIIENIILFIPIGMALAALFRKGKALIICIIFSGVFSASIEIMQYLLKVGLAEFDDIFNNTMGAFLGYLVVFLLILPFMSRRKKHPERHT